MEEILSEIKRGFNDRVKVIQKRPNIYQLYLPVYHEDGDMIDLFISEGKNGKYVISDYGQTLMRLSYSYDIDTVNKEAILQKIITENKLKEEEGNISIETTPSTVFGDIMHVSQVYAKVGSMRYFKREVIESLFYDELDEFIEKELIQFKPQRNVLPIPDRDDLEADYQFSPNGVPIYLFGVKDVNKARLATISCLEYQKASLDFRGWIVNEDFDKLPKKDRSRLTNTCDKQFTTLNDFKADAVKFLTREAHGKN
jgi:hypothetical protein